MKKLLPLCLVLLLLSGCGGNALLDAVQEDLSAITAPEGVQVAALGEASHGVKEYQEAKRQVFQALVENNGCRSFLIEGDFGSAHTVDAYIHGGEGTAQEAAAQIGYRIYRTQEMADLLDWMRAYNETAPAGQDLHFYGVDIQWADASKSYLFQTLAQAAPELKAKYEPALAFLTDEGMFERSAAEFSQGKEALTALLAELDEARASLEAAVGAEAYAFARECARSLYACCDVRGAPDLQYNALRDQYMAEKVQWYLDQGDGSLLFLNGHNGHIGKGSTTSYTCLGEHLRGRLGTGYFAIGTDAAVTTYNAQGEDGSFTETTVENESPLTALASQSEEGRYYVDFASVQGDPAWDKLLTQAQSMSAMNVGVSLINSVRAVPAEVYDAMLIFDQVSPTTLEAP